MTDYYPQEEGAVFDASSYIIPCYPDGAISEMSSVTVGTTVAGRVSVIVSSALGDGIGIALKEATGAGVPTRIPVLFYGVAKVSDGNRAGYLSIAGSFAINSVTTAFMTLSGAQDYADLVVGGGSSYIMGMWLQSGGALGEALLLVGKTM